MKRWLPYYWYFALLYSLPFFFTYMLLKKQRRRRLDRLGAGRGIRHDPAARLGHPDRPVRAWQRPGLPCLLADQRRFLPAFERWDYVAIAGFAVVAGAVTNYDASASASNRNARCWPPPAASPTNCARRCWAYGPAPRACPITCRR
jgi:hypothetical protein